MHVYFVRHGETPLNKKNIHQSPNTALSPKGREESVNVAEYLRSVNPDLLVSSEYIRARETAGTIGLHTGLVPVVNGLFYEIVRPSELYDKSHFHIKTFAYVILSILHRKDTSWRYKDAENFADISNRAKHAIQYLESLYDTHQSVVVVSHAVFINILVSYLSKKRMLDARDLILTFLHIKKMHNTEVIHFEYGENSDIEHYEWKIVDEV